MLTAIGALGPAAVAIIAPIALGFAARYKINALLMGMMVIHGAQAGGFSPISIYGVTVNDIAAKAGLVNSPLALFLGSLLFNAAIGVLLFVFLGGRDLIGRHVDDDDAEAPETDGSRRIPATRTATPVRRRHARPVGARPRRPSADTRSRSPTRAPVDHVRADRDPGRVSPRSPCSRWSSTWTSGSSR